MSTTQTRLLKAIPHIVHDVMVLDLSGRSLGLRVGWVSWYVMARNLAIFLEVTRGGDKQDIRASNYFERGSKPLQVWKDRRTARLAGAPPELSELYADASRAAAHLSWRRIAKPLVQIPSREITNLLAGLSSDFVKSVPNPYRRQFFQEYLALYPDPEEEPWGWSL